MTEKQITDEISSINAKIEDLKKRNVSLQSIITSYHKSAVEWKNQLNALNCSKGTAKKKAECERDKAWKASQADANMNLANSNKAEYDLNLRKIEGYNQEIVDLQEQRKLVSATSKEVSLILANQGLTKAGEEVKAEAAAEAIKNESQTVAIARAEAIAKESEATAESKKVQGWIFAAAGGVILIILSIVLIKKIKKK